MKVKDISSRRFGKLAVISISGRSNSGGATWLCVCDCGKRTITSSSNLLRGLTRSCGCGHIGSKTTHGLSKTRLYNIHALMMRRCYNPKYPDFKNYGGRGVTVCSRWHDLSAFVSDNSDEHEGKSLDRIDNSKGYSPENCRWTTKTQQQRNMRSNRTISAFGKSLCLSEWAETTGISTCTIRRRLSRGLKPEQALSPKPKTKSTKTTKTP